MEPEQPDPNVAWAVAYVLETLEGTALSREGRARASERLRRARQQGELDKLDAALRRRVDDVLGAAWAADESPWR